MWFCMFIVGYLVTFLFRAAGPAAGNLLHTIILILNMTSSGGVAATEVMPAFFRIGLGLPFFQARAPTTRPLSGRVLATNPLPRAYDTAASPS